MNNTFPFIWFCVFVFNSGQPRVSSSVHSSSGLQRKPEWVRKKSFNQNTIRYTYIYTWKGFQINNQDANLFDASGSPLKFVTSPSASKLLRMSYCSSSFPSWVFRFLCCLKFERRTGPPKGMLWWILHPVWINSIYSDRHTLLRIRLHHLIAQRIILCNLPGQRS